MSDYRMAVVLRSWRAELKKLRLTCPLVTAGRLAVHMGTSRTTAKKYLQILVNSGFVQEYDFIHVNGQTCTAYIPIGAK